MKPPVKRPNFALDQQTPPEVVDYVNHVEEQLVALETRYQELRTLCSTLKTKLEAVKLMLR